MASEKRERQERERRCILWNKIERFLFSPVSAGDKKDWCVCFLRSLAKYWEIDPFAVPGPVFPNAGFNMPIPDFSITYDLSGWDNLPRRSSMRMMFKGIEFACHDIDHAYHDRSSLSDLPTGGILPRYPNKRHLRNELMSDIEWVLDRYLLHPCVHLHPMSGLLGYLGEQPDDFRNVLHEVRLGLGITNPFAALFQFRINLLLGQTPEATKVRKETERNRVAKLVLDAILNDELGQPIPPGKLFDLR